MDNRIIEESDSGVTVRIDLDNKRSGASNVDEDPGSSNSIVNIFEERTGKSRHLVSVTYADAPASDIKRELELDFRKETLEEIQRMMGKVTDSMSEEGMTFLNKVMESTTGCLNALHDVKEIGEKAHSTTGNIFSEHLNEVNECQTTLTQKMQEKKTELESERNCLSELLNKYKQQLQMMIVSVVLVFERIDPIQPAGLNAKCLLQAAILLKEKYGVYLHAIDNRFRCILETTSGNKEQIQQNIGYIRKQLERSFLGNIEFTEQVEYTNESTERSVTAWENAMERVDRSFEPLTKLTPAQFLFR